MTHWFHAAKIYAKTIGERLEPVKPLVATTKLAVFPPLTPPVACRDIPNYVEAGVTAAPLVKP
jgi:hypothetical protein